MQPQALPAVPWPDHEAPCHASLTRMCARLLLLLAGAAAVVPPDPSRRNVLLIVS